MNIGYPSRIVNLEASLDKFPELTPRMAHWIREADPLSDQLIEVTADWRGGRLFYEMDKAVRDPDAAPPEFGPLLEHTFTVPTWVDFDRIANGGEFFLSTHVVGGIVLGARSLIMGYAAPAGNKPLVLSGRLEGSVNRRLAETSRFVFDVNKPGNLRPGGAGISAALKVRLIHAKVRQMIRNYGEWHDEWGAPINQHDMMATILLFGLVLLEGLEHLGLKPSSEEAEDYIMLWRYVGYLLGVEPELLPATRLEAERMMAFVDLTQAAPDEDARRLTAAFLNASAAEDDSATPPLALGHTLARELLGEKKADALGIQRSRLRHVIPVVRGTVRQLNHLRLRDVGRKSAVEAGIRYWEWVLQNNPAGPVDLTLPETLLRKSIPRAPLRQRSM
jgi:hypothetical protein